MSSLLRSIAVTSAVVLVLLAVSAVAGVAAPTGPVLTLHARAATIKGDPCDYPPIGPCSEYDLDMAVNLGLNVYVVAAGVSPADGIREASFQVLYNPDLTVGFDLFGWSACGNLEYPVAGYQGDWPASGSGNRVVWTACQAGEVPPDGVHAVAGFFYLYAYSADTFSLVGPPIPGFSAPEIVSCGGTVWPLASSQTATVAAGNPPFGCNPCLGDCPEVDFFPCEVSPTQIDFGDVAIGSSADRTFTVTNISSPSLNVPITESCAEFEIVDPPLPLTLAYGEGQTVTVRFTPAATGLRHCELYPCAFSLFTWGTRVDGVPAERRTWGRIKTTYRQ